MGSVNDHIIAGVGAELGVNDSLISFFSSLEDGTTNQVLMKQADGTNRYTTLTTAITGGVSADGTYATAGTDVLKTRVSGDTNPRFTLNADGSLEWGPGNAVTDLSLARTDVGLAQLVGSLEIPVATGRAISTSATLFTKLAAGTHNPGVDGEVTGIGFHDVDGTHIESFDSGSGVYKFINSFSSSLRVGTATAGARAGQTGFSGFDSHAGSYGVRFYGFGALVFTVSDTTFTLEDGKNIAVGSGTGTKIGTATTEKLGFFNATPVVRRAAIPALTNNLDDTSTDGILEDIDGIGTINDVAVERNFSELNAKINSLRQVFIDLGLTA